MPLSERVVADRLRVARGEALALARRLTELLAELDELPTSVSLEVREARARLGMRQRDLADALGTTPTTVQRWERASSRPNPANLAALRELVRLHEEDRP